MVYTSWHWKVANDASGQNKVMKRGGCCLGMECVIQ